jgi:hypothetical protein
MEEAMHYDYWGDFWYGLFFAAVVFAIAFTIGYWVRDRIDHPPGENHIHDKDHYR